MEKDKWIEVEFDGRMVRIMAHTLEQAISMGAMNVKKVVKETPKELLKPVEKVLPAMVLTETPLEVVFEKPARKTPVKSKKT